MKNNELRKSMQGYDKLHKEGGFADERESYEVADTLPFKEDAFEISVSFGVLEHVINQKQAIPEMAQISKVQIFIVHASLPYGLELIRKPILHLFGLKDQPVEKYK